MEGVPSHLESPDVKVSNVSYTIIISYRTAALTYILFLVLA